MCLALFHFLLLKWKNKYWDLHHIYIFIKIKLGATKAACTVFLHGFQDNCENNKSNMTPTSLTGKSLKPTWGARWCRLSRSRCVTDKHRAGSINRLIALSLLPLKCTQSWWLVGVFVRNDKIPSISGARAMWYHTKWEMQTHACISEGHLLLATQHPAILNYFSCTHIFIRYYAE